MSQASLEIQDLLAQLQREGQPVDSGSFSLDVAHAREKLRRYQLADASSFVLKWLQSGVARGAAQVDLTSSHTQLAMRLEGCTFAPEELESLFHHLLNGRPGQMGGARSLRALAIGVNSALAGQAYSMSLESWDGERGFRHVWRKAGPWQGAFQGKGGPYSRLKLRRKPEQVGRSWLSLLNFDVVQWLFSGRSALDREQTLVADHHFFLPVPLTLNGRKVPPREFGKARGAGPGVPLQHHLLEVYYSGDRETVTLRSPRESRASLTRDWEPGEPISCAIGLTPTRDRMRLVIVEDGVALQNTSVPWQGIGAVVVACGSLFQKDLCELSVVQEERYRAFLELTGRRLQGLQEELIGSSVWRQLPSGLLESLGLG